MGNELVIPSVDLRHDFESPRPVPKRPKRPERRDCPELEMLIHVPCCTYMGGFL